MFDNVKQLENEIKDFEQNILASKDLITTVRNVANAVSQQTDTMETESKAIIHELRNTPDQIRALNNELGKQLETDNSKLLLRAENKFDEYNQELRRSTENVKDYHSALTTQYSHLLETTKAELDSKMASLDAKYQSIQEKQAAIHGNLDQFQKDINGKITILIALSIACIVISAMSIFIH